MENFLVFLAQTAPTARPVGQMMSLWDLIRAGGVNMIFLAFLSVVTGALIIHHFVNVTERKLLPRDFTENLLSLLERREYEKAASLCRQQPNLVADVAAAGLKKVHKGGQAVDDAVQNEGKRHIERVWQNLSYLGDATVVAPLLGLLGTIIGMIQAFSFFKAGTINPIVLTQGLAKAMVNTAFGLVIAVVGLCFYAYFRGRVTNLATRTEALATEMANSMKK